MGDDLKLMTEVDNNLYFDSIYNYALKEGLENQNSAILDNSKTMIKNCDAEYLQKVCKYGVVGALDGDDLIESVSASYFIRNNLDSLSHNTIISLKSEIRGRLKDHISDINNNHDRLYRKHWKLTYKALKQKDKDIRKVYRSEIKHQTKENKNILRKKLVNMSYNNITNGKEG
jgi:hypothetical protein